MNKNEPKKSPAVDFFAWLHSAAAKRNPDIHVGSPTLLIEVSHLPGSSHYSLQSFFLNAFAAFARAAQKSQGRKDMNQILWQPQVQKIPATVSGKTTWCG
ncbi:hypothetical protein ACG2F4_18445 [Halalkalibaculum sp. DA3122]|uniref:hypothetical protein n=1 Tax=Halalkalibaculum sp. DA3122 TaxID=3373607 RepID=UPI003754ABC4